MENGIAVELRQQVCKWLEPGDAEKRACRCQGHESCPVNRAGRVLSALSSLRALDGSGQVLKMIAVKDGQTFAGERDSIYAGARVR
jgi:hypothetical protein